MKEELLGFGFCVLLTTMVLTGGVFALAMFHYYIVEPYQVSAIVDGKVVFEGRKACVSTESVGAASKLTIKRGPFCMLPGKTIVTKNVEIKTNE